MNTDTPKSKDQVQEEDKFWTETGRQFFSVPHASLVSCLKNHVWHCNHIYSKVNHIVSKLSEDTDKSRHGTESSQNESDTSNFVPKSIVFPLKANNTRGYDNKSSLFGELLNINSTNNYGIFNYLNGNTTDSLSNDQIHGILENDNYFNPLVSAKHDSSQRLPHINATSLPDAIHLSIYCPENSLNIKNESKEPCLLSKDNIPEILSGPSPAWFSKGAVPKYKKGCEIGPKYKKCDGVLDKPKGYLFDPVWETENDVRIGNTIEGSTDLLKFHDMSDSSAPSRIDYSPLLYTFVMSKPSSICKRCLGFPMITCPLCNTDPNATKSTSTNTKSACFNSQLHFDDKYQMVYNSMDISKLRNITDETNNVQPNNATSKTFLNTDDEIVSTLHNYLQTLNSLGSNLEKLIKRVEDERRPDYSRWSKVEMKMLDSYIEQYNDKTLDTRYTYTTQKQSFDVLRLRLGCPKSSCLPSQWTDRALCSICGSDEDWDDDPILFCDCCYLPMHFCCLGFKPGTMNDHSKHIRRRHHLSKCDDDDTVIDDDEWLCPSCSFLLDQISFIDESISFPIVRIAAGPKNKKQIDIISDEKPLWDHDQLDSSKLPYIIGFEYDNPYQKIHICFVAEKSLNDSTLGTAGIPEFTDSMTLPKMLSLKNAPTLMIYDLKNTKPTSPYTSNAYNYNLEYIAYSSSQFKSFKDFASNIMVDNAVFFEERFHLLLSSGDYHATLEYLNYVSQEDSCVSRAIQQDIIVESNRVSGQKKGKKGDKGAVSQNKTVKPNSNEIVFDREDHYTLNCKNPLKKLAMSVKYTDEIFFNLKIPVCIFCGFDAYYPGGGPMKRTSNIGTWGHVKCAIAMDCTINPTEIDYSTFVPKVKALKCLICHNWSTSIIQCSFGSCCKAFHVPCAASSPQCLFSWDTNGRPDVLCPTHASGLAPTVLLRKLQSKLQHQNKKIRDVKSSIESLSPKDDVYLTHFLQPNYRSVANVIQNLLLLDKNIFAFPLSGDFLSKDNPGTANTRNHVTKPIEDGHVGDDSSTKVASEDSISYIPESSCPVNNIDSKDCVWCCLNIDESGHNNKIFDDKTPSTYTIGSILFSDYTAVKSECMKIIKDEKTDYCKAPPGILAELCDVSLLDDKIMHIIHGDFVSGQKLIYDSETKVYRTSLDGLTRLFNLLYVEDYEGNMMDTFKFLLAHINKIRAIDHDRQSHFEAKSVMDIFNCLNSQTLYNTGSQYTVDSQLPKTHFSSAHDDTESHNTDVDSAAVEDVKTEKTIKPQLYDVLRGLNASILMKLNANLLPSAILRSVGSIRQSLDMAEDSNLSRDFGICSGCLEFKANEQHSNYQYQVKRKRSTHAEYFRTCKVCNAVACSNCLITMESIRKLDNSDVEDIEVSSLEEGFENLQDFSFTCVRCQSMINNPELPLLCCVLCSRFDGLLVRINPNLITYYSHWGCEWNEFAYVHLVCLEWLTWSKQLGQVFKKLPKTLFEHPCYYCGVMAGATMQCANNYCNVRFHASCAGILGCKVDMSKKVEGVNTTRRALCLRHTMINIGRSSAVERKFMVAPSYLYEILASISCYIKSFFSGAYISKHCVNTKARLSNTSKSLKNTNFGRVKSHKSSDSMKQKLNVLKIVNYINLGLIAPSAKSSPIPYETSLPDSIARDRLIQAMNYAAMNGMNAAQRDWDRKDIKMIISMLKSGLLKPIQGSKRGRKPKSLDGSDHDRRHKMSMEEILRYGHSGQLPDGEFYCPICFCVYFETAPGLPGDDLHWIGCDRCERWFHFVCAGVWTDSNIGQNKSNWYCPTCVPHLEH
ncbi:conserved hypothetical protein [Theileria equi strain WA]|uniref:PHD-type domain-containing protein n=1 Tax=Theileria equi strain WA TaxID=1537102 RepID=L1LD22_THEEQ|nr:conserved hypothetical protein [Theileria equi strain WA]EKX73150.1 conserved hypothetical protein [Theileria equi strain WA]|eukprot:XP_004832602.1 conserved hypothetical protein [Theileria equi strain WA]